MKNRKLKQIFDFTDEDLEANRQGYLTDRQCVGAQAKRIEKQLIAAVVFVLALAGSLFGLYLLFRYLQNPVGSSWIGIVIFTTACVLVAVGNPFVHRQQTLALQQDMDAGVVERHAGMGWREKREVQTRNGKETYYTVRVGTFYFGRVDEDTYGAFLSEHCYAVYHLPRSRHVVAVEMVDCLEMDTPPEKTKRMLTDEVVDIPALSDANAVTYLVYSLRGQGTYNAAIKWYTRQDQPPRIAWEQQGDDPAALHEQATSRLPKIAAQLHNKGWHVTHQKQEGDMGTDVAAFQQVLTLEQMKTEAE